MPRKQWRADFQSAIANGHEYGVSQVRRGELDDAIVFNVNTYEFGIVAVTASGQDISAYPDDHKYLFMVEDDDAPSAIVKALERLTDHQPRGLDIFAMFTKVCNTLTADADGDTQMPDSQIEDFEEDFMEDEDEDKDEGGDEEDVDFFGSEDLVPKRQDRVTSPTEFHFQSTPRSRNRVRQDLIQVKQAGFRVGSLGPLVDGSPAYLYLSCRINKLGISDEAMQAWQIQPEDYLVLLLHFKRGYKHIEDVEATASGATKSIMDFRFGTSLSYKPSTQETMDAFALHSTDTDTDFSDPKQTGFRRLFISGPLQDLFTEKFCELVKYRLLGMSWDGAIAFWHDHQHVPGKVNQLKRDLKYRQPEHANPAYPEIVNSDHIRDAQPGETLSLPLIAMQFYIRQLVRCTEFCLVCHRKMPQGLEAIKPYVCESQLCLFQYMQLGFGPSIEHEIIAQPRVVDLLISLCWESANKQRLKSKMLPRGMGLKIPRIEVLKYGSTGQEYLPPSAQSARVDLNSREIIFDKTVSFTDAGIKRGDWIVLKIGRCFDVIHCRITNTSFFPVISISEPLFRPEYKTLHGETLKEFQGPFDVNSAKYHHVTFFPYNEDLDNLKDVEVREAISALLDLLPSVHEMREYLIADPRASLKSWVDRIPPPSLGLLRWVIASNRACIMQLDNQYEHPAGSVKPKVAKDERVWGMPGYLQFRFAMGAPDKERRFLNCVKDVSAQMNLKIPTMFAWHGSPLHNWHSIIREGLNFDETAHGRAFGHGVYFSKDVNTSMGYSNMTYSAPGSCWAASELKICSTIALNEIVNAPSKFVHTNPHLVVNELDWIQTRYLFVKTGTDQTSQQFSTRVVMPDESLKPENPLLQDPHHTPNGPGGALIIPSAASKCRFKPNSGASKYPIGQAVNKGYKKIKAAAGSGTALDPIDIDQDGRDETSSVMTDDADLQMLQLEDQFPQQTVRKPLAPLTDFVPGQLDLGRITLLKQPEGDAASMMATKRLQQDFKAIRRIQDSQPLHELGWYIDPNVVMEMGNMYQWIIELHSFDQSLPLAKDMKAAGIKSVVLEMRFGKDYPMTPPFVRVIRPRFLSFQAGGGGHVTAGGAMCMELLTNNGWSAVSTIDAVLMQVRLAISSTDPRPARLERNHVRDDYGVGEAVEAYIRACQVHGWTVPPGFKEMMYQS